MSIYYSKFSLNTYPGTPYFEAHVPEDYPLYPTLRKCRAFRRLPPRLRELAGLSKQWAEANGRLDGIEDIREWYDEEGNELDPDTGRPLTDQEVDAQWQPEPDLDSFAVADIPPVGFADPETWRPKSQPSPQDDEEDGPTDARVARAVEAGGYERTSREFGIPVEELQQRFPQTE